MQIYLKNKNISKEEYLNFWNNNHAQFILSEINENSFAVLIKYDKTAKNLMYIYNVKQINNEWYITDKIRNCYFPFVGSFDRQQNALNYYDEIKKESIPINIYYGNRNPNKSKLYVVSLGGFLSKKEAEKIIKKFDFQEKNLMDSLVKVDNCTDNDWHFIK